MTDTTFIASIEPSSQVALFSLISLIVTTLGGVVLAWIALQQAKLSRTVQTLEKNTNSMREALVSTTAKASKDEGILQEKADEAVRKAEIVIAIGKQSDPPVNRPAQPAAPNLVKAIDAVPKKTAVEVVKTLEEQKLADK